MCLRGQLKSFGIIQSHLSHEATKFAILQACNAHCPFLQGLIKHIGHSDTPSSGHIVESVGHCKLLSFNTVTLELYQLSDLVRGQPAFFSKQSFLLAGQISGISKRGEVNLKSIAIGDYLGCCANKKLALIDQIGHQLVLISDWLESFKA